MRICTQCGTRFSEPVSFCPHDGTPTQELNEAPPQDPLLGRVIDGRYRVEKQVGEGGMGVVYLISHAVLGKRMALKVLRGEMAKDADVVQRFMQEAQSATSIGHPNIIDISDFGRLPDGSVYFVMEYLDGDSLSQMISKGGSVPMATAVHIVRQIASALDAAHARGIVHRDMKPDNIYLVKQGDDPYFVKVLDFGIAKVGGANSKLTRTGMIFGTPHYMSPEQASGQSVDKRTDIYALGVIMYEMFTGKVPFDGDTFMGILSKHMFEAPVPPSQVKGAGLGALEDVILKTLAKKAEERYQSMGELLSDLDRLAAGGQIQIGGRPRIAPPGAVPGLGGTNLGIADALEPPSRTEMRLSAPSDPGARGSRGPWIALALVALLVIGLGVGGGVFYFTGGMSAAAAPVGPQPIVIPIATAPPPVVPPPVGTGTSGAATTTSTTGAGGTTGTTVATTTTTATETAPTAPATIVIATDPVGAEVYVDQALVGNTPIELPRPGDGEREVVLRLAGYQEQRVVLSSLTAANVRVTLTRAAVARSGGGSRRGGGSSDSSGSAATTTSTTTQATTTATTTTTTGSSGTRRTSATSEVVDPWAQ